MKKKIILTLFAGLALMVSAHAQVQFKVADGIQDGKMKTSIENALSGLLTEVNAACAQGRDLNMNKLQMTDDAKFSIGMLWENIPFECMDPIVVERVLRTPDAGYQVRNIPIELKPKNPEELDDDPYQEAVVEFNSAGKIISFYFGLRMTSYKEVMKSGKSVTDTRRRMMIVDYVEHFRTAYNQHDIAFIEQVFSDDAIIITGKVTTTKKSDMNMLADQTQVEYVVQNKKQYISRLKQVFARNKYINVEFEDLKLASHPTRKDFYGVTVKQNYSSTNYSDEGYLFLLWDFRDEAHPQIHVRTWQPYWLDSEKTKTLPEDEIFDVSSFDLSSVDY